MKSMVTFKIPVPISSEMNLNQHWSKRRKRFKSQEFSTLMILKTQCPKIEPPCSIVLTRIAPRTLDYDNMVSGFKKVRDTVASFILDDFRPGRADSDPRITWTYKQEKGAPKEYAFKIEIEKERS